MIISYNTCKNIKWNPKGYYTDGRRAYIHNFCETCGKPYLAMREFFLKGKARNCSNKCGSTGINNPWYKKSGPTKDKKYSKEHCEKLSLAHIGKYKGKDSPAWKGGGATTPFDTYSTKLFFEEIRCKDDNILEVRCTYCNKWFKPERSQTCNRINGFKGSTSGENRFYCSDGCRSSCEIFGQVKYPKGHKTNKYSREVQPDLRKLVLERDDWICQKCGRDENLHCHHYEGIEINPIESAYMDNCITLCKKCHNKIHKDCNMRRRECES